MPPCSGAMLKDPITSERRGARGYDNEGQKMTLSTPTTLASGTFAPKPMLRWMAIATTTNHQEADT